MKARPTLEEVKEYFKNAKEVQSPNESDIVDITIFIKKNIHGWAHDYWIDLDKNHYDGQSVLLWDRIKGYAKIISYKEETYQITKEQIFKVCNQPIGNTIEDFKDWYPSVFKEDKKELVVGIWYKWQGIENNIPFNVLICLTKIEGCSISRFGFVNGRWNSDRKIYTGERYKEACENLIPATPQEIQQALENECEKIGIVFNATVKAIPDQLNACNKEIYTIGSNFVFNGGKLYAIGYGKVCVFKDGKFATVVKPMTQQQIEKELGYEISII